MLWCAHLIFNIEIKYDNSKKYKNLQFVVILVYSFKILKLKSYKIFITNLMCLSDRKGYVFKLNKVKLFYEKTNKASATYRNHPRQHAVSL